MKNNIYFTKIEENWFEAANKHRHKRSRDRERGERDWGGGRGEGGGEGGRKERGGKRRGGGEGREQREGRSDKEMSKYMKDRGLKQLVHTSVFTPVVPSIYYAMLCYTTTCVQCLHLSNAHITHPYHTAGPQVCDSDGILKLHFDLLLEFIM